MYALHINCSDFLEFLKMEKDTEESILVDWDIFWLKSVVYSS